MLFYEVTIPLIFITERLRQEMDSSADLYQRTSEEKEELVTDVERLKHRVYELEGIYKLSEDEKETLQRDITELNRAFTQLVS